MNGGGGFKVTVTDGNIELNLGKIFKEEIFKAAVRCRNEWQQNLQKGIGAEGFHGGEWRDTGDTINDVTVEPKVPSLEHQVGGDEIGLAIAEYGRRPNAPMPPHKPIARWAKRKGLTPKEGQTFGSMVFGIRKAIGEKGIRGFAPARLAAVHVNNDIERNIKKRIDEEVERAKDAGKTSK